MSFINIASGGPSKKYVPSEVKCYNCTEPGLKLKFGGRSERGKVQFIDIYTNEIHVCKNKYLKTVTCKLCGVSGLKWIKSVNTKSGVELVDKLNKLHNCQNRNVSDYYEQWKVFYHRYIFGDPEKSEEENKRIIKASWDKALGVDESGLTYNERELAKIPQERKDRYKKQLDDWARHDFNNFINCKCETCDNRRRNPKERTFHVKKRK